MARVFVLFLFLASRRIRQVCLRRRRVSALTQAPAPGLNLCALPHPSTTSPRFRFPSVLSLPTHLFINPQTKRPFLLIILVCFYYKQGEKKY